ncbi:MAG TPA: YXWGXW repeat-containing protein [Burkholderiaceae bacterium]|nr:YXWGXW repeat-containing protein [Burkholderiaceae bacterium]
MTIGSTLRAVALAGACASMLSACVVEPVRPPRPAPVMEIIPPPPAAGYHWVTGHYRWRRNHWKWVPGHWKYMR